MSKNKYISASKKSRNSDGSISRRGLLKAAGGTAIAAAVGLTKRTFAQKDRDMNLLQLKGNINHSVCRWCYSKIQIDDLAGHCARIGVKAIDLVKPEEWPVLKKHGLVCSMVESHGITKGLNRKENHSPCLDAIRKGIESAAEAGYSNVICFSGNREGMPDDEGLKNCTEGIKKVIGLAEQKGITLCMELLNSKRGHKDYMCDHTEWGVELCKRVDSPRFKLLYDIFHMQIMEGDIISTIKNNIKYIGHFHTGGVPGRNEIDETQELYYPAIMRAIAESDYKGYVAQEFIPKKDPIKSMEQAIRICDV